MSKWNASNYRQRRSLRLVSALPEWVTNPETGEEFLLRRSGAMAAMLANFMPAVSHVADSVVSKWQEQGVDVGSEQPNIALVTPEKIAEGERDLKMMARVVAEACVIPHLSCNPIPDEKGLEVIARALSEQNERPSVTFDISEITLDPAEMDDSDVLFIFRFATGQVGALKGGGVVNMADLKSDSVQPKRMSRAGYDGAEFRSEAEPLAAVN